MSGENGIAGTSGSSGASGSSGSTGVAGAGAAGAGGSGGTTTPNLWATSANEVEVFVNGTSLGASTSPGATLAVAAKLNEGAENIIAIRASKGAAATPYLQAEMDGAFGRAGTSTQWKAKAAASTDEQSGGAWAATSYDDSAWTAAKDVNVSPVVTALTSGPARGIGTGSKADTTAIFRMRFYIPANWSASKPYGFGSAVTGGQGGATVTVTTPSQLAAAVAGNTATVIRVSGTIDFTGSEGSISNTCCYVQQCKTGQSEYITNGQGQCDGQSTFTCTYDKAGTTPLSVGSNKTIIGVGPNATIKGKGFILGNGVSNVIIRNLNITSINPQVVWGGDAIDLGGAKNVWIDHNHISLIARQFIVTHFNPNPNITISYNDMDGNTPYSGTCNGAHYYVYLIGGTGDTITLQGNWMHNTAGRGPHAGGNATTNVIMHWVNDYNMTVPGHASDAGTGAKLLYEGTAFDDVATPFVTGDGGFNYAPLSSNLSSTNAACQLALGRACVANSASPQATYPLDASALTAMSAYRASAIQAYPASEVPFSVPHLAGTGHI
jgi:pectate lyase